MGKKFEVITKIQVG